MTTLASADFPTVIAERIRDANHDLAAQWLGRLRALLPVEPNDIFPSDQILDHIPVLIREIAECVGSADAVAANTTVQSKARELGDLRFEQRASVHQLVREYRILSGVLSAFVHEQMESLEPPSPGDGVVVMHRLSEAVFVLLQTTVDTFVGRYTNQIDDQTTRLESFNRMVSHELRQPLSSAQHAVELLGNPDVAEAETRTHLVTVADRNIKRLAQLLNMLSAVVRPEHDSLQLQPVDMAKIVTDIFGQLKDAAEAKGVTLRQTVPALTITTDLSRLELILVNLVANSIKYRDPRRTDCVVEVSLTDQESACVLSVRDNGLGIPEADQRKIFRRFFRAHASRDAELANDGVGLGLAIAADCAKGLRGTLTFESKEGVGTTFTLVLPHA